MIKIFVLPLPNKKKHMKHIDFKLLAGSEYWDQFWILVKNLGYNEQDIEDFKNGKDVELYNSFIKFHNKRCEQSKKIMENLDL